MLRHALSVAQSVQRFRYPAHGDRSALAVSSRSRATLAAVFPAADQGDHLGSELLSLVKDRRGRLVRPTVSTMDILSGASPLIVDVPANRVTPNDA